MFTSVNYAVGLGPDSSGAVANGVLVDGNAFEGCLNAIYATGAGIAGSTIAGLRVTNNRAESCTNGFALFYNFSNSYAFGSFLPPWFAGNTVNTTALPYVSQSGPTPILVNSLDYNGVGASAPAGMFALQTNASLTLQSVASAGGDYDALNCVVQTAGGGITLANSAGTLLASLRYNGTSANMNLAANGAYQSAGTQVVGAQQTTGVGSAAFTANAGTALNSASTFDGYTLAQVVKALRNHGLLA
jgi:hypothetical protein